MQAVIVYILVEEDTGLLSISWMDLFQTVFNSFQGWNVAKKALYYVLAVFLNLPLLRYFPRSNFGWSRNLRYLKIVL